MIRPSGDQRGLSSQCLPSVIRVHDPPVAGVTKIAELCLFGLLCSASKTIQRPSGENRLCHKFVFVSQGIIFRAFPCASTPAAGSVQISDWPVSAFSTAARSHWLSGDQSNT